MAIKNFLFSLKLVLSLILIVSLSSCANLKTRRSLKSPDQKPATASDVNEPESDDEDEEDGEEKEETAAEKDYPKLGVILGPGSVKAFAHAGVLKELHKSRIPIHSIVGLEWGALVAGLYAKSGKIHDVEWRLYKLEAKNFKNQGFFGKGGIPNKKVKDFRPFLNSNIGEVKINSSGITFACPSISLWSGVLVWQQRGALTKAIEKCLPYPPLFEPQSPWMAAAFSLEESVAKLRDQGAEVIMFVNVLDKGKLLETKEMLNHYSSGLLWQELRRSTSSFSDKDVIVVNVKTGNFKLYDFKNRNALVRAGERAGEKAVDRLVQEFGF